MKSLYLWTGVLFLLIFTVVGLFGWGHGMDTCREGGADWEPGALVCNEGSGSSQGHVRTVRGVTYEGGK